MKVLYRLIGLLLLAGSVHAQKNTSPTDQIQPLKIGDTIPNILIRKIYNYKTPDALFSDWKGKLVLIDFWFGACPGCIESFPKMESLQEKFGNRIQVLMVNFETQEKIEKTLKKWHNKSSSYRPPKLPSIVSDTIFHQLFPHQYYPHEVWIDSRGVVKAFTSMEEVTEEHIMDVLHNKPLQMDMKMDNLTFDDAKSPIFQQVYSIYPTHLKYYSLLLNYIPGLSGGMLLLSEDSVAKTVRVSRRNMTILELFVNGLFQMSADPYQSPDFDFGKRIFMEIKDSTRYFYKPGKLTKAEWRSKNCYCYEEVMPNDQKDNMFKNMTLDLERLFNASCKIEKKTMKCMALVRTSALDKIYSKNGKVRSFFDPRNDSSKYQLYAGRTKYLVEKLARIYRDTPYIFIDNTGYNELIDIDFDKQILNNFTLLRSTLQVKYDLDLVETEQPVDVLVFKENDYDGNL